MDELFSPVDLTEDYKVGIPAIDREHQYFIELYNDLVEKVKAGADKELWNSALQKLFDYAASHFANEEQVMSARQFPGFDKHKRQHLNFVQTLTALADQGAHQDSETALKVLLVFAGQWVRGHILLTDKELGEFASPAPPVP